MKKFTPSVLALILMSQVHAEELRPLRGFGYGQIKAPTGQEWQNPEAYAHGKLQPTALFYSFRNVESALGVMPRESEYYQSLDGKWHFRWVGNPHERTTTFYQPKYDVSGWDVVDVPMSWNIYGLQRDGKQRYGTPIYVNQPVIFYHERKVGDWKEGVMRTPPTTWTTYKHRNEVGAYRRTFQVPKDWDGREIVINFDGVDSFFYLWINGNYVGFSKNSRNRASFDITPYLKEGENVVAAEVYRTNDGSFLEAQDMFRLPGIFRSVSLTAKPKVQVEDLQIIPDLDDNYQHATLAVRTKLANLTVKRVKGLSLRYSLYSLPLYQDKGAVKYGTSEQSSRVDLSASAQTEILTNMKVHNPKLWSAEAPHRYVFVAELLDERGGVLETISTYIGIREVEIRDVSAEQDEFGLAGRYYLINGKPVKLKGVNRHETHPAVGHAITHEMQFEEVMLMKRANINHVRNSHYPTDPYFYYLADKYGLYLEDEANIESHQYYYGKESLSHVPEFDIATTNRMLEMVYANINHPSIVIWSLGNEAGPGKLFNNSYEATKKVDTSRPIQYERNNDIVDMGSNQYPSIPWVCEAVKGKSKIKYPFHISEYAHSMGNAVGGLQDYWTAMESTNFFCGGAIWDWVDQAMYNYEADGTRYLAYGGNFGDFPNNGMFVMNGIIFADREPKPQYYEVKKVYQNVGITAKDIQSGKIRIFNKNYFTDLSDYKLLYTLHRDGVVAEHGALELPTIAPRSSKEIYVGIESALQGDSEYFLKIELVLKADKPWAKAGYAQMDEQILVQSAVLDEPRFTGEKPVLTKAKRGEKGVTISGKGFRVVFDDTQGTIHTLNYGGKTIIAAGNGPKLDAFRAAADNDNWAYPAWGRHGLHNLKHRVLQSKVTQRKDGSVEVFYTVESQAPNAAKIYDETGAFASGRYHIDEDTTYRFTSADFRFLTSQTWIVYLDGSIELQAGIGSNNPNLALGRLGYELIIPKEYNQYSYYGRGPINNYSDRKTSQFVGLYSSTVVDQFVNFPKPQTMGNREEVRWVTLRNASGSGVSFQAGSTMSASALPWSAKELLLTTHPHKLPKDTDTHLHLDASVNGLGGNSCGQGGPLEESRSFATAQHFSFIIRPLSAGEEVKRIKLIGKGAPSITRDYKGEVTLSAAVGEVIYYSINGSKPELYRGSFIYRKAMKISAWTKSRPEHKVVIDFPHIEHVPLKVAYVSSEEAWYGSATNLLDNNSESTWHTMYSVTVAQYPHWIDFDAGVQTKMHGFIFIPRLDNNENGDIKDYEISISNDGKEWRTLLTGSFPREKKEQRVMFKQSESARYIRLKALSAHNGADFAAGSTFKLIAD